MSVLGSLLLDTTSLLVGVALGLLSLLWWLSTRRPAGAPPGPGFALPLLGHLHLMDKDPRAKFRKWRQEYGDVFSMYLGNRFVVVLCGYPIIKEAFVKMADVFSERPHMFLTDKISNSKGVLYSSGPVWKEQRKTSLEILRKLGMGKNVLAERILEEVAHYLDAIEDYQGEAVDLHSLTSVSISNNICSIVLGHRFDYDDKDFKMYLDLLEQNMDDVGGAAVLYIPFLEYLPGDMFGVKKILKYLDMLRDIVFQPYLDDHTDAPAPSEDDCTDFIYSYLREKKKKEDQAIPTSLCDSQLMVTVTDLFIAGTETTAMSILWSMLFLMHRPDIQDKCYKEIVEVLGTERLPNNRDRTKMVYTEAFILEVLRTEIILPLALHHGTSEDISYRGHFIPKDTIVLPLLDTVLHDPDIWGDPEAFRPERFIGADGKLNKPPEFIPFSTGRRVCLGEALARMELFLYVSSLIQRFHFLPPEPGQMPPIEGFLRMTWAPKRFKIRAVRRN